ncbi:hypothetical protein FN846DRAFT_1009380 [Sphaerosporella brunnea]|uniref:HAT C-terminal dimerisation domain-containing protein n=1 Tax=Sphaerosporella brunnea TaxID=1250544 RepID=A0A5J5FAB4_9PEZI|nr:hypothetical protein FN846DRAFT_1009380 [Sphaerosporella brunnea]
MSTADRIDRRSGMVASSGGAVYILGSLADQCPLGWGGSVIVARVPFEGLDNTVVLDVGLVGFGLVPISSVSKSRLTISLPGSGHFPRTKVERRLQEVNAECAILRGKDEIPIVKGLVQIATHRDQVSVGSRKAVHWAKQDFGVEAKEEAGTEVEEEAGQEEEGEEAAREEAGANSRKEDAEEAVGVVRTVVGKEAREVVRTVAGEEELRKAKVWILILINGPASSSAVERIFSGAGNFQGANRPRLLPATIQAACLLKAWWRSDVLGFDSLLSVAIDTAQDTAEDTSGRRNSFMGDFVEASGFWAEEMEENA